MKKLLVIMVGLLAMIVGLLSAISVTALDFSNEVPTNNSFVAVNDGNTLFTIDCNETITSATLWMNGVNLGIMNFAGTSADMSIDLSSLSDNTTYLWWPILNSQLEEIYNFKTDNIPSAPTNVLLVDSNETSIELNWDDNSEADLAGYRVYRNGTMVINESTLNVSGFVDVGLVTGSTYTYMITAVDVIGQESPPTLPLVLVAQDTTPPSSPIINPPNGAVTNVSNNNIAISYSENVSLKIYSGVIEVADLGNGLNFNWLYNFSDEETRFFTLYACDGFANCINTPYILTYDDGSVVSLNFTVIEGVFWMSPTWFPVIDETQAGGYIVYGADLYFNGMNDIRFNMSDVMGVETLRVNEDIQPILFCNLGVDNLWDGTGYNYNVDGIFDYGQSGFDACVDIAPGDPVMTTIYLQIPVPTGTTSGDYTFGVDYNYNVTI